MPRKARLKSESGIYHIIMRGINRMVIFNDYEDRHRFFQTLKYYKKICGYKIYAYCLMNNHFHLLLSIGAEPLEQVMRRICGKYVYWYNNKYDRVGYLFQDRFKSEPVENEAYFLTVLRYIHQNPLKAGMAKELDQYPWSSYNCYLSQDSFVDINFALNIFNNDIERAVKSFIEFNRQKTDGQCLEVEDKKHLSDQKAVAIIKKVYEDDKNNDLQKLDKKSRDYYLNKLKQEGLSIRQIERLTGINRGIISRARG